jgi:hypothetical protein
MVPSFTNLRTSRSNADLSVYTTVAITPTAGKLLVLFVHNVVSAGTANTPTITGGGISTWTVGPTTGTSTRHLSVHYGLTGGSPTSEALTIDFAEQTQNNMEYSAIEIADCLLTGTNGADAIVQSANDAGGAAASFSLTFGSAWDDDDNLALAAFVIGTSSNTLTAGTNFTMLGQVHGSGASAGLGVEYGRDADLVVDMSAASNGSWRAIAVEIAGAADGAGPDPAIVLRRTRRRGLNQRIN